MREHLTLIKTATRRDIHDEETAIVCARRVKDVERLKMLYLLTVADSMATGPAAWNNWTSHLLREFFLKVLNTLEKGELASAEAVGVSQGVGIALVADWRVREDSGGGLVAVECVAVHGFGPSANSPEATKLCIRGVR